MSEDGEEKQTRYGDYVMIQPLGQGSFGRVILAQHVKTQEQVAIKIVDKSAISTMEEIERVYRETFILLGLRHRNIIRLYEVLDTPRSILLVMEYAGGGELAKLVQQRGRLTELETCRLFQQIVSGVEYCHRQRVIHRDLKLENILLDKDGTIKIADFGLSNCIKFGQKMDTSCGTPAYTCPEQILGHTYIGSAADVWSLGIVLFRMVAGFLPFEHAGGNLPALFRKITQRQLKFPPYISKECQDLLDRMLTVDPDKRCSISELRNHPWFLMELTDLAAQIQAMPPVTPAMIEAAHEACLAAPVDETRPLPKSKHAIQRKESGRSRPGSSARPQLLAPSIGAGVGSGGARDRERERRHRPSFLSTSPAPDGALLDSPRSAGARPGSGASNGSGEKAVVPASPSPALLTVPGHHPAPSSNSLDPAAIRPKGRSLSVFERISAPKNRGETKEEKEKREKAIERQRQHRKSVQDARRRAISTGPGDRRGAADSADRDRRESDWPPSSRFPPLRS